MSLACKYERYLLLKKGKINAANIDSEFQMALKKWTRTVRK